MPVSLHPLENWLDNVALGALSSRETVRASYDIACAAIAAGVPGDFVECGVFGGAQCAGMARAIYERRANFLDPERHAKEKILRRVHLFDTFQGIPQAGPEDKEFLEHGHEAGVSACSLEDVKAHLIEWGLPLELFVFHKGLLADTVSMAMMSGWNMADKSHLVHDIAVLRLDCDLYESTRDALPLYQFVSPGGWIIVDDWQLSGARKAVIEAIGQPGPVYFQVHSKEKV